VLDDTKDYMGIPKPKEPDDYGWVYFWVYTATVLTVGIGIGALIG